MAINILHEASIAGDVDAVRAALESGIAIESADTRHGNTALMLAAYNNHPAVVDLLLAAGASVEARCFEQNTALMKAAWAGAVDCADRLIRAGADVDAREANGMTALMVAAFYRHMPVVRLLVESGADANAVDDDGYSALKNAQVRGHAAIASFLEKRTTVVPPAEASANFELKNVRPFLEAVAGHIEQGFSVDAARALVSEIAELAVDDERAWVYRVVFGGQPMTVTISVFMDDIDSPDVTVIAPAALVKVIDAEMDACSK